MVSDNPHDTLVVSSPTFSFDKGNPDGFSVSVFLLGGKGGASAPSGSLSSLPPSSSTTGFLGVALRRISDGAYLLHTRRSANAQYAAWEGHGWTSSQIAQAIEGDAPNETYCVDVIDQFHGGWGWLVVDSVTVRGVK